MTGPEAKTCNRCKTQIALFTPHVFLRIAMQNGVKESKRYCGNCSNDESLAVLFADIINQPIHQMLITKVWG